jgi:hypothetical protein
VKQGGEGKRLAGASHAAESFRDESRRFRFGFWQSSAVLERKLQEAAISWRVTHDKGETVWPRGYGERFKAPQHIGESRTRGTTLLCARCCG